VRSGVDIGGGESDLSGGEVAKGAAKWPKDERPQAWVEELPADGDHGKGGEAKAATVEVLAGGAPERGLNFEPSVVRACDRDVGRDEVGGAVGDLVIDGLTSDVLDRGGAEQICGREDASVGEGEFGPWLGGMLVILQVVGLGINRERDTGRLGGDADSVINEREVCVNDDPMRSRRLGCRAEAFEKGNVELAGSDDQLAHNSPP